MPAQVFSIARAETVLEWRFDQNLNDTSGNGLHGAWIGGGSPTYGAGPDGFPCVFLDGSHYIKRSVNDTALRLGTMTLEAYIKPTLLGGQQNILDFRQNNGGYDLRLMGNQQAQLTIQLDGFNGIGITTQIGSVSANRWVHLAATRDTSGVSRIYVNGSIQRTRSDTYNATNTTFPFHVGRPVFNAFPDFFHGFIAHIRISNTALSPDQFLPPVIDCNGNEVIDSIDLSSGTSSDCNTNRVPDECDIASETVSDNNRNGVPDECDVMVVNSLDDPGLAGDGLTTLREAMEQANVAGGFTITFDPALAGGTIRPTSGLPDISGGNITINGDMDDNGAPDIEIDGSLAGFADGIRLHSPGNSVIGLVINGFQRVGILLFGEDAAANTISHCYVGTNFAGNDARSNGSVGIWMQQGTSVNNVGPGNVVSGNGDVGIAIDGGARHAIFDNMIGVDRLGAAAIPNSGGVWIRNGVSESTIGPGNLISGNVAEAVVVSDVAHDNRVISNWIGTDSSGQLAVPNGGGINVKRSAFSNTIGPGNVISGNYSRAIVLDSSRANQVRANLIGTNSTGSSALPNGSVGVILTNGASENTIGPGNVVSGNDSEGLVLEWGANANQVIGNKCGTDITGTFAIPNYWSGILIQFGGFNNTIGGPGQTDGNLCSGNRANGVTIRDAGSDGNIVAGNFVGTDATGAAPLPNNDHGIRINNGASDNFVGPDNIIAYNGADGIRIEGQDTRANTVSENTITQNGSRGIGRRGCSQDQIDAPTITAVSISNVSGTAIAPDGSVIEVFHDPEFEGQTFLGSTLVASGVFSFAGAVPADGTITATVTDLDGNTSEFGSFRPEPPAQGPPHPNDFLVASREYGTVYAVDPQSGVIRGLVSGPELRNNSNVMRGEGPSLVSFHTFLLSSRNYGILARFGSVDCDWGLMKVDSFSGNRVLDSGTNTQVWDEVGDIIELDSHTILSTADHWKTGDEGTVLQFKLDTGSTIVISGPTIGDGPVILLPRPLAKFDDRTLVVVESGFKGTGAGAYWVDVPTGNRRFLSRLTTRPFARDVVVSGNPAGEVMFGDDEGGTGPTVNTILRSVAVLRGRIFVGHAIRLPEGGYNGGILEINPVTGDRTLMVGQALEDDGTELNVVEVLPTGASSVFLDAPIGITDDGTGNLVFTTLFGPFSIFRYDLDTGELDEIADVASQLEPSYVNDLGLTLAIFAGIRGDFDRNGRIDLDDYVLFSVCESLSGPGVAPPFSECLDSFDFDDDSDVDLLDWAVFQVAFTGEI